MNAIIRQLMADHKRYQAIYQCIARQTKWLENDNNSLAPIEIIAKCLLFINNYPKKWHHPMESLIAQVLTEKSEIYHCLIKIMSFEHEILDSLTDQLNDQLAQYLAQPITPSLSVKASLKHDLHHYIQLQAIHEDKEEKQLFSVLADNLDEKDWQRITTEFGKFDQYLFIKKSSCQFDQFYDQLLYNEKLITIYQANAA